MGNSSSGSSGSPPLVLRPYEEAIKSVTQRLPITTVVSYGRIRDPIPCGRVSNWVTYRISSSGTQTSALSQQQGPLYNSDGYENTLNEGERARMARCCFASATDIAIVQEKDAGSQFNFSQSNGTIPVVSPALLGNISLRPTQSDTIPALSWDEYGDMHTTLASHSRGTNEVAAGGGAKALTTSSLANGRKTDFSPPSNQTEHSGGKDRQLSPSSMAQMHTSAPRYVGAARIPVYGDPKNHKPFLEPEILDYFLPFILDNSLSTCLCVCPHWFVSIYEYMRQRVAPIVESFKATYSGKQLEFESTTFSIQPLFTAVNAVVRIDLLIYCKVLPCCARQCTQFGYTFSYLPPPSSFSRPQHCFNCYTKDKADLPAASALQDNALFPTPENQALMTRQNSNDQNSSSELNPLRSTRYMENLVDDDSISLGRISSTVYQNLTHQPLSGIASPCNVLPPNASSYGHGKQKQRVYQAQFRFETLKKGSRRTIWIHRDICRFHGDELMIASLANVPTVNVDDRLEIPVNISNAFGLVDLNSITWKSAESIVSPAYRAFGQTCEVAKPYQQWVGLDAFQPTTNERLQTNDYFGPQWKHLRTEFTGVDITCSRSTYIAAATGEVPQSRRWLGIESIVKPAGSPIVCPLTRLGLQHDRFCRHHVRQGDTILLYITQGGGLLQ